jgi:hypothetical protein
MVTISNVSPGMYIQRPPPPLRTQPSKPMSLGLAPRSIHSTTTTQSSPIKSGSDAPNLLSHLMCTGGVRGSYFDLGNQINLMIQYPTPSALRVEALTDAILKII